MRRNETMSLYCFAPCFFTGNILSLFVWVCICRLSSLMATQRFVMFYYLFNKPPFIVHLIFFSRNDVSLCTPTGTFGGFAFHYTLINNAIKEEKSFANLISNDGILLFFLISQTHFHRFVDYQYLFFCAWPYNTLCKVFQWDYIFLQVWERYLYLKHIKHSHICCKFPLVFCFQSILFVMIFGI